jgi:type I restriction enzyme M protein
VLRDLYVRGKCRDVILPITVLRRLDAVLEPTKKAALDMKAALDKAGITSQDLALRQAAGQAFYNTSKFNLRDLKARASQLRADFEAYLDGFSPNVQDILDNFEFPQSGSAPFERRCAGDAHREVPRSRGEPQPIPILNSDGSVRQPGLDNHAMGTIFEELVRRFNGGMLTVAEDTLQELAEEHGKQVATPLHGQEINAETYAISAKRICFSREKGKPRTTSSAGRNGRDPAPKVGPGIRGIRGCQIAPTG